jgi:hypothetical protein
MARRCPIPLLNPRKRTPSQFIGYGLYLYLLGVSSRNTAKALSFLHMVSTSHVSVWKWIQKCKPKTALSKKRDISEYIIDETAIRSGSEYIWLWITVKPNTKGYLQQVYPRNGICLLQRGSFRISWRNMAIILFQQVVVLGIRKPVNSETGASHSFPVRKNHH